VALGDVGSTLSPVVALGGVVLGVAGAVLVPAVDVSVPDAFGAGALGLAGWALASGEVFAAVVALGVGAGLSRLTK
jgi:hypothetical protein